MTLYFNRENDPSDQVEQMEQTGQQKGQIEQKNERVGYGVEYKVGQRPQKMSFLTLFAVFTALTLSLAGFSVSLLTIKRTQTPSPVQILCDSADMEHLDRAGAVLEKLIKK